MATEVFNVRADMVDETFWIETSSTYAATMQLHMTLDLARADAPLWKPFYVLSGEDGSGRHALAKRVIKQAQRNASCRAAGESAARGGRPQPPNAAAALADAQAAARSFGHCPMHCSPMSFMPISMFDLSADPEKLLLDRALRALNTPGNSSNHPLRRTSLVFVHQADHLLNVNPGRRRLILDRLLEYSAGRFVYVFIGTPALKESIASHGRTLEIPLPALPEGAEFAKIVRMVFGTDDPAEVGRIHRASGGLMGPLLLLAAMRGLSPPFHVPPDQILRLPAPAGRP